jgi:hypothetical protein
VRQSGNEAGKNVLHDVDDVVLRDPAAADIRHEERLIDGKELGPRHGIGTVADALE